jgi:molybdopterin synthase sulfur carrier subunit
MITVDFLGPIGKASLVLEARTLKEVSEALQKESELLEWLDKCAVAVNDIMVDDLTMVLQEGDRVSILPPVCGG